MSDFKTSKEHLAVLVTQTTTAGQNLEAAISTMKSSLQILQGKGDYVGMFQQVRDQLIKDTTTAYDNMEQMRVVLKRTSDAYINSDAQGNQAIAAVHDAAVATDGGASPTGLVNQLNK